MHYRSVAFALLLVFVLPSAAQESVAKGMLVPAVLETTLDAKAKPGKLIVAQVAQDVPMPGNRVLRRATKIFGKVIEAENNNHQTKLVLQFDRIELNGKQVPISTQMRAIASSLDVQEAQEPTSAPNDATNSPNSWTTSQIGGGVVYRGGGPVTNSLNEVVGTPVSGGVPGGVLDSHVTPVCEDSTVSPSVQYALWLFAPDACGAYGFDHELQFINQTQTGARQIVLTFRDGVKLYRGSGILFSISPPATS